MHYYLQQVTRYKKSGPEIGTQWTIDKSKHIKSYGYVRIDRVLVNYLTDEEAWLLYSLGFKLGSIYTIPSPAILTKSVDEYFSYYGDRIFFHAESENFLLWQKALDTRFIENIKRKHELALKPRTEEELALILLET